VPTYLSDHQGRAIVRTPSAGYYPIYNDLYNRDAVDYQSRCKWVGTAKIVAMENILIKV